MQKSVRFIVLSETSLYILHTPNMWPQFTTWYTC